MKFLTLKPVCIFDVNQEATKITIETKIICITGNGCCNFYYIYENNVKEFKLGVKNFNFSHNFIDHGKNIKNIKKNFKKIKILLDWIESKLPTLAVVTERNDVYILEGHLDKKEYRKADEDDDISLKIERFQVRQHIQNCFSSAFASPTVVKVFSKGLVIGSTKGDLLFLQKTNNSENPYQALSIISRFPNQAQISGLSFNNKEEYLSVAYSTNEIGIYHTNNLIENLNNKNLTIKWELVCDGFHQGPITYMDVALQRPIIVTTSKTDKTIRIWNYLTGHCEYCKIILTEKDDTEKEMDILSLAIHPDGYYMAVSDRDMIRFFHLCYKEIRFYNNDSSALEVPKSNCSLLKFSNGGHLLAAVCGKNVYILRSYSRETLKVFKTNHSGTIKNICFDDKDYFLYSIGNDGIIVEYNLFEFRM